MSKPSVPAQNSMSSKAKAAHLSTHSETRSKDAGLSSSMPQQDVDFLHQSGEIDAIYGGDDSTSATSQTQAAHTTNWSTSLQSVLDQPPSTLPRRLMAGGMIFCVAFGAWAWLGQIEEVGRAQGQLVPKGDVYKIHPVDAGKIATIAVKEGQEVETGQVLVELDTSIAAREVERLQQQLAADQTELRKMQFLTDRTRLEARTRAEISDAELQAQAASITQAKTNAAMTQALLSQLQADVAAQGERLVRLKPLAGKDKELLSQLQTSAAAHKARVARLKTLVKEGAISKEHLFEAEQSLLDIQNAIVRSQLGEGVTIKEQMFGVEQALRDRQGDFIKSKGELQQALVESERLRAGLIQKQAEGQTTQLEASQKTQQLEVETNRLEARIAETQNLLASSRAKLKQNVLTAPVDGVVSSLNIPNTGEVVQPGQTIAEIAPHNAPLILSAILPNREAGFTKVGMPVQIKLDAYPYQEYGIVPGIVASISPNTKPVEQLGAVYQVKVALERNHITTNQQTIKFKAGQTATAEIVIRRRRVADILLDPFKQLQKGGINL